MTLSDDTFQINTPENVDFGYEIAGIGSRFLAALLDTLLITLLQGAALLAVVFGLALADVGLPMNDDTALGWMLGVYALISFGFLWGYYIFFETLWDGQTPGKRRARLRVIRSDGLPIGFAEAAIRNLVRLVDFLPAYYGVGVVAMFIDGRSRRLGDLAAGTLVVRDRGMITLDSLEKEREALLGRAGMVQPKPATGASQSAAGMVDFGGPPSAMAATEGNLGAAGGPPSALAATDAVGQADSLTYAEGWAVKRLSDADLRLAEDFLRRRDELANRAALARQIARRLQERLGLPDNEVQSIDPEEFLRQVLRLRQES